MQAVLRRPRRKIASLVAALSLALAPLATVPVIGVDTDVSIVGLAFTPATVTVEVGDTVTWANADGLPHTVTADDASFDSGFLGGGATFARTFTVEGSVTYHCTIHPSMTGTVEVQAATTVPPVTDAPATDPPDTDAPTTDAPGQPIETQADTSTTVTSDRGPASADHGYVAAIALLLGMLALVRVMPAQARPRVR